MTYFYKLFFQIFQVFFMKNSGNDYMKKNEAMIFVSALCSEP
ncbi:Uncharacterized protein dnm_052290 [Desulfonema magnum]|uniref:Uncharacterized protein n=1 Tax=Desulfonema magnum TaxID=45655 RepID=A0A975BNX7_9BACT|nr:Uncharacterized protein dnm_052290 [Desulfonema magnum]